MSARTRLLRRAATVAAVVAALMTAGAWWLLRTESGLRFAWGFVERRLPEGTSVEGVSGRLGGPLRLEGVRYASETSVVRVARVEVEWRLAALLRRTLDVRALSVEDVRVEVLPAPEATAGGKEPTALPDVSLPVALVLGRARVKPLVVAYDTAAPPFVVDSLVGWDVELRTALRVGGLVVDAGPTRLEASGRVTPRGRYAFEVETSWAHRDSTLGPVVGTLAASGSADSLGLALTVSRPIEARLGGAILDPLGARILDVTLDLAETDLRVVRADGPDVRASALLDLRGTIDSLTATGTGTVRTPTTGAVALEADVRREGDTVRLDRVTARVDRASVTVRGEVALDDRSGDLVASWSDARWPLDGEPTLLADSGQASFRGTTSAFTIAGGGLVRPPDRAPTRVRLRATGSPERLVLQEASIEDRSGTLTGSGSVAWVPELRWDLVVSSGEVTVDSLDERLASWPGRLAFRGETTGSMSGTSLRAFFVVDTILGRVRDEPVEASSSATLVVPVPGDGPQWDAASLSLGWLDLVWGADHVLASGMVADTLALHGTVSLPDVGLVVPGWSGALEARGRLRGSRAEPELEASGLVRDLEGPTLVVREAVAEGTLHAAAGGTVDVDVWATGVSAGERSADSLQVRIDGTRREHTIAGRLWSPDATVAAGGAGSMVEDVWTGRVERLDFSEPRLGEWRLADPVDVLASADSVRADRGCWRSGSAELCAVATWLATGPTDVEVTLADLPTERLAASLPAGWSVTGSVSGSAAATVAADSTLTATLDADLGSGELRYPTPDGPRRLGYSSATVRAGVDESGARTAVGALVSDSTGRRVASLSASLALPELRRVTDPLRTQPVTGSITGSADDLSALDALVGRVGQMTGQARLDVDVAGSVERPEFTGEAHLVDGAMDVPELGLELRDIQLTANGRGSEGVRLDGRVASGGGTVQISGDVPVAPSPSSPARIRLSGTRVQVANLPEAQIWASPDLEIQSWPDRLEVSGRVRIPTARVELSEVPETAVRPSRDVVFVGDSATAAARAAPLLGLDVRLELGDSISLRAFGFSARPTGGLVAVDGPNGTTTATGEITLNDGQYRAYGQDLTIERGRFLFAGGPVQNPGLDVRATRTAEDGVVAGLQVSGSLRRPEVTIFSEPAMMESEALSYIVLGRPLSTATSTEGGRVANAAASLGIRQGNVLASRIADRFGLAEVRVAAEGPLEEASLIAGKYLSPTLYVSYGVGLFEPISTFRLRYLLSGHWTLRAENGRSQALDVLYQIERGRRR